MNKTVKTTLKIIAWIIGSIIGLVILIAILIQVPAVQNFVKGKAVSFLENKIKTKVEIDRIELGLPKKIILEGVYFESQQKDTLIAGDKLAVDISLLKLLDNKLEINSIDLQGITANIKRSQDSVFNFDYIIKALVGEQTQPQKPVDTTAAPMQFSLDKINLDRIRLRFDDAITKNNIDVYLNHFDTRVKKFDLEKMAFHIPKIKLDGLSLTLKQGLLEELAKTGQEAVDSAAKSPTLDLKLEEIDLSRINIAYDNAGSKLNTGLQLGKLLVKINNIDMKNQLVDLDAIELSDTKGTLIFGKNENIKVPEEVTTTPVAAQSSTNPGWKMRLANADFKNIAFKFDDQNSPKLSKGIDYMHLDMQNLNLQADNFQFRTDTISGNIGAFTVKDKSGLNIQSLQTEFFYGSKSAYLRNLYLKTPQTLIRDRIEATYPSIASLSNNPGELYIDAAFKGSKIGFKDILLFVPDLSATNPFKSMPNAIMLVNSSVKGKVKNLSIPNLEVSGIGNTKIAASANIKGLPDVEKASFNIKIQNFQSTSKDLYNFVPAGTIPSNIRIPNTLAARGTFSGMISNFETDMNVFTSSGNAKVKAKFDQRRKNAEKYQADTYIQNLNIGEILKNPQLGRISARAKVNGTGLDPKSANANFTGQLISANFNKYQYQNLFLKGNIKSGLFNASAFMDDPNVDFDLAASGSFRNKYPKINLGLNLDSVDLEKLNFATEEFKVRGKVNADLQTADADYLNGEVFIDKMVVAKAGEKFSIDSVCVISTASATRNTLNIQSPILTANMDGKYQITKLATALTNTISKYYDTSQKVKRTSVPPQSFTFNVSIKNDKELITSFVPALTQLDPIKINGSYNSVGDSLKVNGSIPKVVYGTNIITNATLNLETKDSALNYSVVIDEVKNPQILLPYTSLEGALQNNLLTYQLLVRDIKDKDRYKVGGQLAAGVNDIEIKLNPQALMLNYEAWSVANDNLIRFGDNGIYANNFLLSKQNQSIKIQSASEAANAPLSIDFNNFKIETITSMIEKDSLLVGGTINGNALLRNLNTEPLFTSDLNIIDFNFKADTLGNIAIKVNNETANSYAANVAITGNGNQVNLNGIYKTTNSSFDMNLAIERLNLKSIQGFTLGNLKESTGYIDGNLAIKGTTTAPQVLGNLKFNKTGFRVTPINSYFKIAEEDIVFDRRGITFNRFALQDSANNDLVISGNIFTQTYTDFAFNLDIDAENFRVINSTASDNELYYGQLFINSAIRIRGDLDKPVVDGNLDINKDTKLTIVLPQSDPSIADREGIVEFIDQDNPKIAEVFNAGLDSLENTDITGLDVSMNITVDKEAELTMVIDKGNGDFVKLKGEAELTGGIDPSGKTSLTGRYVMNEGSYEMSFNFLKRKFDIEKGSTIIWTGEPTTADVNLTAIYRTETAPIDLVGDQLTGSDAERNTYKQKLPFEVLLMMKGELLEPEISFDIRIPEGNYAVAQNIVDDSETKLAQIRQQPSELNKQVFALLLLNRFIGENPFASEAGSGGAGSLARQSVSKILSQQLNNLAGDLIAGVELNFDLESTDDYTTGSRKDKTDLNVGISKRLLNDRLKVTVGSSFGLEGPQQANQSTNNIAGDVAVDYQLSKDGRYVLRAYNKNQYEVALQGQVVETGVGFIITIDYNRFSEIFERSKQRKRKNKDVTYDN